MASTVVRINTNHLIYFEIRKARKFNIFGTSTQNTGTCLSAPPPQCQTGIVIWDGRHRQLRVTFISKCSNAFISEVEHNVSYLLLSQFVKAASPSQFPAVLTAWYRHDYMHEVKTFQLRVFLYKLSSQKPTSNPWVDVPIDKLSILRHLQNKMQRHSHEETPRTTRCPHKRQSPDKLSSDDVGFCRPTDWTWAGVYWDSGLLILREKLNRRTDDFLQWLIFGVLLVHTIYNCLPQQTDIASRKSRRNRHAPEELDSRNKDLGLSLPRN